MITYEDLVGEMKNLYFEKSGTFPDDASDLGIRFRVLAGELYNLFAELNWMKKQMNFTTAEGEELDKHALGRGLTRAQGTVALGTLQFKRAKALWFDVAIPKGTICQTQDGTTFETIEQGILGINQLSVLVKAKAQKEGISGNAKAGTITRFVTAVSGIETVTNLSDFSGGTDTESDEMLRQRIEDSFSQISTGSNAAFYQNKAMSHEGVRDVYVVPRENGVGTVGVYLAATGGVPSDALLSEVEQDLQKSRELNVTVSTHPISVISLDVEAQLVFTEGVNKQAAITQCKSTILDLFDSLKIGQSLTYSAVYAAIYGTGVVTDMTVYFYGTSVPAQNKLLIAGTITVEEKS
jgi:uncharacterized phage protein gp47/JayE